MRQKLRLAKARSSDDDDAVEEALRPEFVELLKFVTREQVNAPAARCPHPETAEHMGSWCTMIMVPQS